MDINKLSYVEKVKQLNSLLKEATNYKDIQKIEKIIDSDEEHLLYFVMKRSDKTAFDFKPRENGKRVRYLLDDGVSMGNSKVVNLHKNIKIS